MQRAVSVAIVIGIALLLTTGCASTHSTSLLPTSAADLVVRGNLHPNEPADSQFEYGHDRPVVDGLGNIVGIPRKLLLWNRHVKSHSISHETENELREYIAMNDLDSVKIRVNQYAPLEEWQRLCKNKQINPIWRCTAGTFHMIGYTLFPGRVFGRDEYNPYTNTVSIYSDVPSLGLAELAYAKDIQHADYPGLYAVSQEFAGVDMIHTTRSTEDVLNYLAVHGSFEELEEGYETLYPAMGLDVGDSIGSLFPQLDAGLGLIGAGVGHITGRVKARRLHRYQD